MLNLRNSPIARTPPSNITSFPDILIKGHDFTNVPKENGNVIRSPTKKGKHNISTVDLVVCFCLIV